MSDHHQHGLMMARPPRRDAAPKNAAAVGSAVTPAAPPAHDTGSSRQDAAQGVVGLFGKLFHRRNKPD
jgi:hypothetical protein